MASTGLNPYKAYLENLKSHHAFRDLKVIETFLSPTEVQVGGKKYLQFCSNDYLGLSFHPEIRKAFENSDQAGSTASRLITGTHAAHAEVEDAIAKWKGVEAALLFNSGTQANCGVPAALAGIGSVIFSDSLNHASLIDGIRLSGAERIIYPHVDLGALEALLIKHPPKSPEKPIHRLIVTDSVFSMDGDVANLPKLLSLCEKFDAYLYIDEAHGSGVLGEKGRGLVEAQGIDSSHPRLIQMGTLGKAVGVCGAYVCGSTELKEYLINTARSFIFSTSLPIPVLKALKVAIQITQDSFELRHKLKQNCELFSQELKKIGIENTDSSTPIFPVILGSNEKALAAAKALWDAGIWVQAIRPPTVPDQTARLRITLTSAHSFEQIQYLAKNLECVIK